jgi:glycosyltransferase involved in cell wall biosynthesis
LSKTKVLFVVPDLELGGAERHVVTLLPRLDPMRYEASVVCIGKEGTLFAELRDAGIPATALNRRKSQAAVALRDLVTIMRRERPAVVVCRGYNAEVLGRAASVLAGVKHCIVWVHQIGDFQPRGMLRGVLDAIFDRWTAAYFGVAQAQRQYLVDVLRFSDDKIHIIYNGVDPAGCDVSEDRRVLAEFGWLSNEPVVGILAALRPEKDHETLLRAARIVIDVLPSARFLVIGDGKMRDRLELLARDLGIESQVHFTGSRTDVVRLLRAIDVFTLSSVTVECFPMALLEAMACGRAAVCTAVGGVPEIIDHGVTGYLVPPQDPAGLAERLIVLLTEPQTRSRMGVAGRERVEREFTLDRSVVEAQAAFDRVLAGRKPLKEEVSR